MGPKVWKVMSIGSGLLATVLARRAAALAWRITTGSEAPTDPADPDTEWKEAVGYAVVSGALAALTGILAKRGAARYYTHSAGHRPPELT